MKKCILINSPIFWDAAAEGENYLSPLGLGYIATYVEKAGIQVEILDAVKQRKSVEDIVKYIEEKQPDYVGINIFTQNYKLVKAICEQTKVKCEWFIGGLVVGSIYEEIVKWNLKNRMNIIIGDGEYIIPTITEIASPFTITGPATVNILTQSPNMIPSFLNSIAGLVIELENPVIGTIDPAPAKTPILS